MNVNAPKEIKRLKPAVASIGFLGERRFLAYKLREEGLKFNEVGNRMGVSAGRAQQLYQEAVWRLNREPHWTDGLSVRAANCLNNCNISSREGALAAYQSHRLKPLKYPRNYGWKSHKEIAKWLGLPEPKKAAAKVHLAKTCPHCGGKLGLS